MHGTFFRQKNISKMHAIFLIIVYELNYIVTSEAILVLVVRSLGVVLERLNASLLSVEFD